MKTPLELYALLYAIAEVKTGFDENAKGKRGEAGVLLLPGKLVHDVNTFTSKGYRLSDRLQDDKAFEIAAEYLKHYGKVYELKYKASVTEEALTKILHYGCEACLESGGKDDEGIWVRVRKEMKR